MEQLGLFDGELVYIPNDALNLLAVNINYAVPTSNKKFFGNIPYGSTYIFAAKSVVVGVHWFLRRAGVVLDGVTADDCDINLAPPKSQRTRCLPC